MSGDVRRCLELLRRAAEITEAKAKQAVSADAADPSTSGQPQLTGVALFCPDSHILAVISAYYSSAP